MHTILITIQGPRRSVDLEVPGELPISELIPVLLELCGPIPLNAAQPASFLWASWGLRPVDSRQILAPNRSLIEAGVVDGAVLQLHHMEALIQHRRPDTTFTPRPVEQHPGGIGVSWGEGLLS